MIDRRSSDRSPAPFGAPASANLTALIGRSKDGDRGASAELFSVVYDELREIADRYLASERSHHTLQPTALVHEAYLRMFEGSNPSFENRAHFFGAAARAIRRILIDRARARRRERRGGGRDPLPLEFAHSVAASSPGFDVLSIDLALQRLAELDPQKAKIVELRFFGGLDVVEVARALGTSPSTITREWRFARAWLHRELCRGERD